MSGFSAQTQPEALQALHDIVIPGPVSWIPQTVGWLVLGLLILAALVRWGARAYRRWQANRYRGAAMSELIRLQGLAGEPSSRTRALRELPVLVKRTALSFSPREEVASLAGEAWLDFLDRTWAGNAFTQGGGRRLLDLDYRSEAFLEALSEAEREALFALVGRWISRHSAAAYGGQSLEPSPSEATSTAGAS